MPRPGYDEALQAKAILIAEQLGAAEASKATGIPAGTIRSWLSRAKRRSGATGERRNTGERCNTKPRNAATPRKITVAQQAVVQAAMDRAIEEASEYVAARLKALADQLYGLAEKTAGKIELALSTRRELQEAGINPETVEEDVLTRDRDGAAWLRSLVGVLAQSIDKAQLLSGRPTSRSEERRRHEYDITQRILGDPEAVELAEQLLRRAAGRGFGRPGVDEDDYAGAFRLDGDGGALGPV